MIISKELLNTVVSKDMMEYCIIDNELHFRTGTVFATTINIHELAHKVKEWVISQSYTMASQITMCKTAVAWIMLDNGKELIFDADTEPEAIFKVAEWILNKNKL